MLQELIKLKEKLPNQNWISGKIFSLPPPPPEDSQNPPPSSSKSVGEIHLPSTNFLPSIRAKLIGLERTPYFKSELEPILGVLVALVLGAFLGLVVALGIDKAILSGIGASRWLLPVLISPVLEEIIKAICMLAVAVFIPRVFPNRRYGVLLGAATGLGFGIFSTTLALMGGEVQGFAAFAGLVATPVTQPLYSAFVGIGVFIIMSKMTSGSAFLRSLIGLPLIFLMIAILNHIFFNSINYLIPGGIGTFIGALTICPLFAFWLRDFLGGHFNFNRFLKSSPESASNLKTPVPPPP
jgi:RsiW-degrading membrane proteinase PrsW (M82 family)